MPRTKKPTLAEIEAERAEWQRKQDAKREDTLTHLSDVIIPKLEGLGVAKVQVEYSGYGDSGAINSVDYLNAAGKAVSITSAAPTLDAEIENVVEEFLPDGFEINEGGQGDVFIDVANRRLTIRHEENYTETHDSTKEISF